ncbi:MAG: hypothetical protein ACK5XT_02270 [Gemmatimonas sp.]|uniref:hypothetical protein n=1 Tax=Gemmatimonas sp. TaxID=1962908 RepID=UPI00391FA1AB
MTRVRRRSMWARHAMAFGVWLVGLGGLRPSPLAAQRASTPWRFMQEGSGWFGSTWLEGPRAPTVRSTAGGALGIGMRRAVREDTDAGVMLRAALQPISLHEAGATWREGTLREVDALGMLSMTSARRGRTRLHLEGLAGIAVLNGLGNLLPFRDAGTISPVGEVGLAVSRIPEESTRRQRELIGFARVGMVRLGTTPGYALITPGWVNRIIIGVRSGR